MSIVSRSTQQYSGFDPRSIPGCALWLDGADSNSMFQNTTFTTPVTAFGQNVQGWSDKSGNGRNMTYTGSNPTFVQYNGRNAISLNTSGFKQFSSVDLSAFTYFLVMDQPVGRYDTILSATPVSNVYSYSSRDGFVLNVDGRAASRSIFLNYGIDVNDSQVKAVNYTNIPAATTDAIPPMILGMTMTSAGFGTSFINGVQGGVSASSNARTTTSRGIALGGYYLNSDTFGGSAVGYIYELLMYTGVLTTSQRQQVEGYLAWKWSLTTNAGLVSPSTIPGLALWLDGADPAGTGVVPANGSTISTWRDKSVNSHVLTAVNTVTYDSNGLLMSGSVSSGSGNLSGFTNSTFSVDFRTRTVIMVFTQTNNQFAQFLGFGPTGSSIFTANDRFRYALNPSGSTGDIYANNGNTLSISTLANIPLNQRNIWIDVGSTSTPNISFFVKGTASGTGNFGATAPTTRTTAGIQICRLPTGASTIANEFFNGYIHEIIVYESTLTTTQRQQIEGYLAWKWGLQASLPTSHPYVSSFALPTSHPFRSTPVFTRPFLPIDIDGLALWLDAADRNTISFSSGSNVSQWRDKSGNGRHSSIQAGSTGVPILSNASLNSQPSIYFAGNSALTGTLPFNTTTATFFAIANYANSTGNNIYARIIVIANGTTYAGTDLNAALPILRENSQIVSYRNNVMYGRANFTPLTPFMATSLYDGVSNYMYVNGSNGTNVAFNFTMNTGSYTIACDNSNSTFMGYLTGNVGEVIVFSNALTTSQRQQIEGYLAAKWGLSTSLPPAIQAVPSIFDPRTISGCRLWLDAADSSTLSPSTGSLSTWTNKGTAGGSATSTGTVAPTISNYNGYPSLYFPGSSNTVLTTSSFSYGSTGTTWFAVAFNLDSTAGLERGVLTTVVGVQPERSIRFTNYANANAIYTINNSTLRGYAGSGVIPANGILCFTDSASLFQAFVNGTSVASNTTAVTYQTTSQVIQIGKWGNSMLGHIQEVLIYDSVLTTSQRQQIEGYLYAKWNVPVTRHPYYRIQSLPTTPIFTPASLSGLQLWLDAADSSTISFSSGSNVSQWNDKSGNGRNTTVSGTPVLSNNATLSRNGIYLNGTSFFTGSFPYTSNTLTYYVVGTSQTDSDNSGRLISFGTTSNFDYDSSTRLVGFGRVGTTNQWVVYRNVTLGGAFLTYDSPYILGSVIDGTSNYVFLNGTNTSNAATSGNFAFTTYGIGNSAGTNQQRNKGFTFEVVVYSNALTTAQRQAVEGYLAWKWGLRNNLPLNFNRTIQSPLQIPGCQLWLDAADSNAIVFGTGSNITRLIDKSPLNLTLTNATSFTYDSVNRAYVGTIAGGSLGSVTLALSQPVTVFAVAVHSSTSFGYICDGLTSTNRIALYNNGSYTPAMFAGTSIFGSSNLMNTNSVYSGVFNTTNSQLFRNGTSIASGNVGTGSVAGFSIATAWSSNAGWLGSINEIIIYNTALTTSQRQSVEAYLQNKWNVAVPAAHPYKNFRP